MTALGRPECPVVLRAFALEKLEAIIRGQQRPIAVAHPLEFACIPLLRSPGLGICGHIWQNGRSASTIHSHSWHLYSDVVAGAVLNEMFTIRDRVGHFPLLAVESLGSLDRITPTGRTVEVREREQTLHRAGDSYKLPAGFFHRSTPMSTDPTVTLLTATSAPGAKDTIVATASASRTARRENLPPSIAVNLAKLLRDAITDAPSLTPARDAAGRPLRRSPVPSQLR